MHAQLDRGLVALDHPAQLQRLRGPLGDQPSAGLVARIGHDQPTPRTALDADRRGQPAPPARHARSSGRNGVSRDRRSQSVSSRSTGSPRAAVDQHPAGQVLEHHRAAGQVGRGLDQPGHRRPLQPELGEGPVHVAGEPHLLELLGHDRPVHALGHVDEPHRPVQRDQREAGRAGPAQRRLRHRGVRRAELDHQPGGADLDQLPDEVVGRLGGRGHAQAGGQHQLVAGQHRPDVAHLGDVHPAEHGVQAGLAAEHHRVARGQVGEGERLADGDRHGHSVAPAADQGTDRPSPITERRSTMEP